MDSGDGGRPRSTVVTGVAEPSSVAVQADAEPGARRTLGALGGPQTFGGQAAKLFVRHFPELGEVKFVDNSAQLLAEDGIWRVDAACVPAYTSRTGPHENTHRRLVKREDLNVLAEDRHSYRCALLVKPGAELRDVSRVLGHTGSINQSRLWLAKNLPDAAIAVVTSHSLGAAQEALDSDGSVAAVGTLDVARDVGLEVAASDIDGGSVGLYWALSPTPAEVAVPTRVVVAGVVNAGAGLVDLIAGIAQIGHRLVSLNLVPMGDALFHDGCVAYFSGEGPVDAVREIVFSVPGMRLAGAYRTRCTR